MHNNRGGSRRVSYFRSALAHRAALSSTSLLLAMLPARRPTYRRVFIDGLFLYTHELCVKSVSPQCGPPLRKNRILEESTMKLLKSVQLCGISILWIIKLLFRMRFVGLEKFRFKIEIDFYRPSSRSVSFSLSRASRYISFSLGRGRRYSSSLSRRFPFKKTCTRPCRLRFSRDATSFLFFLIYFRSI